MKRYEIEQRVELLNQPPNCGGNGTYAICYQVEHPTGRYVLFEDVRELAELILEYLLAAGDAVVAESVVGEKASPCSSEVLEAAGKVDAALAAILASPKGE